jgi:NAD(P)-dependent dehydrogenase (short-subunit alcohol dehydrogenase family)
MYLLAPRIHVDANQTTANLVNCVGGKMLNVKPIEDDLGLSCPLTRTAEGYELQFATNHLSHFLLAGLLAPLLLAGAPARVVSVSSRGHRFSPVGFDDIHFKRRPYDKWAAYG